MGKRKNVTSDFPLRKLAKKEDQISELPDEILVHILSFLAHEDAARTSILSKRWIGVWIGLWMYADGLNFESAKMWKGLKERSYSLPANYFGLLEGRRQKYVKWVNQVVQSHKGNVLDVLRIRFYLGKSFKKDIDKWLQYAFARRVQSLELNLLPYGSRFTHARGGMPYDFPLHLLLGGLSDDGNNYSGAESPLSGPDAFFGDGYKSLRSLRFERVNVCGSVLQFFLHNCPFLEHLAVGNSETLKHFEVCGPSLALKHLEIICCANLVLLRVCDTNIVSLKVGSVNGLVLKNVPKLVDVFVGRMLMVPEGLMRGAISRLSCCLSKLEVLTLTIFNSHLGQVEGVGTRVLALPQLTALKQFTFALFLPEDNYSLVPFTYLIIRAAPNLEKFALKTDRLGQLKPFRPPKKPWRTSVAALDVPLQHLGVVELYGYFGHANEVELVKYLLDNVISLERIIIDPRDQPLDDPGPVNIPRDEAFFGNLAKQQLQGVVPSHVQLVVL